MACDTQVPWACGAGVVLLDVVGLVAGAVAAAGVAVAGVIFGTTGVWLTSPGSGIDVCNGTGLLWNSMPLLPDDGGMPWPANIL